MLNCEVSNTIRFLSFSSIDKLYKFLNLSWFFMAFVLCLFWNDKWSFSDIKFASDNEIRFSPPSDSFTGMSLESFSFSCSYFCLIATDSGDIG